MQSFGSGALSLFTAENLERLMSFFWSVLNVRYPILHRPSFKIHEAQPDLVLAIAVFSATRSSSHEDRQLAAMILPELRGSFLSVGVVCGVSWI